MSPIPKETIRSITHIRTASRGYLANFRANSASLVVLICLVGVLSLNAPANTAATFNSTSIWGLSHYVWALLGYPSQDVRPAKPSPDLESVAKEDSAKFESSPQAPSALPCTPTGVTLNVPGTYATVQLAIDNADPGGGDTIQIAAGTYTQQFVVNKCVNIVGAGQAATIIKSPLTLAASSVPLVTARSIVEVRSNSYVTMKDLTVSGPVPFTDTVYGIFVDENSTLKISNARVTAIHQTSGIDGVQNGHAIVAGRVTFNQIGSLDLNNVTVDDYQKTGIIVSRNGSTATITNSTITGMGPTSVIGQNGIQVSSNATATITGCTISGNQYTPNTVSATGILPFDSKAVIASGNLLDGNDVGIYQFSSALPGTLPAFNVSGNTFSNNPDAGILFDAVVPTIEDNFISGSNWGIGGFPTNGEVVKINRNSIKSPVGTSSAGIYLDDWDTGTPTTTATLDAHFNEISGNNTGAQNDTASVLNAENNFWGCNAGSTGGAGCDTTAGTGSIDADPWLVLNHTTSAAPSVNTGGTTTVSTNLRFNSNAVDTFTATDHLPNPIASTPGGIPVIFSSNIYGSVLSPVALVNGQATSTFTGGGPFVGNQIATVTPQVDNATDSVNITVNDTIAPTVSSIVRTAPNPTNAASVSFTVTFDEPVQNVDTADFALSTTGVSGTSIAGVTPPTSGSTFIVLVNTGSGSGTIRLDTSAGAAVQDIAGNAYVPAYTAGETYTIDKIAPTVTIVQAGSQADPTSTSPIHFTVNFNEPTTDFVTGDVSFTGSTAGGTMIGTVTGSGSGPYDVAVTGMTSSGLVIASIAPGTATDAAGNGNAASTSTDDTVNYTNGAPIIVVDKDGKASTTDCDALSPAAFTTIQAAIDAATAGSTVKVCSGSYTENVVVNKQLTILGPNDTIDPNTGSRVGEALIYSAVSNPSSNVCNYNSDSAIVTLAADGVIFKGFTLNGDNPLLSSGYILNGSDIDAYVGISGPGTKEPNENVSYNIIRNMGEFGIDIYGSYDNGARTLNSTISHNKVDNVVGVCYGNGLNASANAPANITDNVVTRSFTGVSIQDFNTLAGSFPNSTVSGNDLTGYGYVIWFNLHYGYSGNGFTITNNAIHSYVQSDYGTLASTVRSSNGDNKNGKTPKRADRNGPNPTPDSVGGWGKFIGIKIESVNAAAPVTVTNNTISPDKSGLITDGYSMIDGIRITNPSTTSSAITISGNTVSNTKRGLVHTAPAVPTATCNTFYNNDIGAYVGNGTDYNGDPEQAKNGINLTTNSFVGNTSFGVQTDTLAVAGPGIPVPTNAINNFWGSASGPGTVGTGTGDNVSPNVNYTPFAAVGGCSPSVSYPTVTLEQVGPDPTNSSTINFTATFSENVTGFSGSGISLSGSAGATTAVVSGSGSVYNVAVSGMTASGTVVANVVSGAAFDISGEPSLASTSIDNSVTYDNVGPSATVTTSAPDPTNTSPINFIVSFSEPVGGFGDVAGDFAVVNGTVGTITGTGPYTVAVTPSGQGIVSFTVNAGAANDLATNPNTASNTVSVVYDSAAPTVTVNQASGQGDPTSTSPINFTVTFSEDVTGFTSGDVNFSGAGATTAVVSGGPSVYNVAISGMNTSGPVTANIPASSAVDASQNGNTASTSTDNTVQFDITSTTSVERPGNADWFNWDDQNDTALTEVQDDYIAGPPTPPLGSGSARLRGSTAAVKPGMMSQLYQGTRLADFTTLRYDTYVTTGSVPYLQFDVDYDNTTGLPDQWQGRAYFLPDAGVSAGTWQSWDALSNQGKWRFTGSGAAPPNLCPINGPGCKLAFVLSTYPNMAISAGPTRFGLLFRTDPTSVANVDNLVVGVNSVNRVFDFEQGSSTVTLTCSAGPFTFNGTHQDPCTAYYVTSNDPTHVPLTVTYSPDDINAGPVTATATWSGDDNHTGDTQTASFTINQAPITAIAGSYSGVYDGNTHLTTPCTVTGFAGLTCSNNPSSVGAGVSSGTVTAIVDQPIANFVVTYVPGSYSITAAPQTITFAPLPGVNFGHPDFTVTATASSGLAVTFTTSTPACTVSPAGLVHLVSSGTCTIVASQGGNVNYSAAPNVSQTFEIGFCPIVSTPVMNERRNTDVLIPVSITDTSGGGIISVDLTLAYDPAVLSPAFLAVEDPSHIPAYPATQVHVEPGTVGASASIVANQTTAGIANDPLNPAKIKVSVYQSAPLVGGGPLVYVKMHVIGTVGSSTPLTIVDPVKLNGNQICSNAVSGTLNVVQATTATTVASSLNPSIYGDNVTFTASVVTTPVAGSPVINSGTVNFEIDGSTACSATVVSGMATCSTASLNVGSHPVVAHYVGNTDFAASDSSTLSQVVILAASATLINCPSTVVYNGSAQTPCIATVTGAGGLSTTVPVIYGNNTNVGTATANASYAGDLNHTGSTATQVTFAITQAGSTTTIDCSPGSFTYTGSAITPCVATVTRVGDANTTATVVYTNNTNVGTATANASYAGDLNHTGSTATQVTYEITQAASTTTIDCSPGSFTYTGSAITPCVATVTRVGDPNTTATVVYTNNTNVGTATANASYAGDLNHTGSTATQVTFAITQAASTTTIDCSPGSFTYTGSAITPCVATVTRVGDPNTTATVVYTNNTNVGTATANASYAGDLNHTGSTATQVTFAITKANANCSVTGYSVNYDAQPHTATGSCTGVLGEPLVGLNLTGTTHTAPSVYSDIYTFADVTGNYNDITNGAVIDTITSGTVSGNVRYSIVDQPVAGVLLTGTGSVATSATTITDGTYSMTNFGSGPYTVTPTKPTQACDPDLENGIFADDASLVSRHVVGLTTLTGDALKAADVSGLDDISSFDAALIARRVVGLCTTPSSRVGNWVFTPHPAHGSVFGQSLTYSNLIGQLFTGENYTAIMIGDVNGDWSPLGGNRPAGLSDTANAVRVSLPHTGANAGSVAAVPFKLENLNGAGVSSYQFDIEYDPKVVEPAEVAADLTNNLSTGLNAVWNVATPGLLKVVVYGAVPATGDGVYLNLRFTMVGGPGSSSPLSIGGFRLNDGQIPVFTNDGRLTVEGLSNTASVQGRLLTATGQGITNARLLITSTTGQKFATTSSSMGFYSFNGLVVGETYTVNVQAKRFTFSPRTVSVTGNVTDFDMIADQ